MFPACCLLSLGRWGDGKERLPLPSSHWLQVCLNVETKTVIRLRFNWLSLRKPILRDKFQVKGKRALLRKLAILERRWTLVPKNQLPSLLGFVQRLHRRKSKGLCVEGCGVHDRLMNIFLICWLVRINIFNLLCPTSLGSTYFWLAYSQHFPPRRKFQYMQDSSKGMAWNITYSPLGRKKGP